MVNKRRGAAAARGGAWRARAAAAVRDVAERLEGRVGANHSAPPHPPTPTVPPYRVS